LSAPFPEPTPEEREAAAWLLRIEDGLSAAQARAFAVWVEAAPGRSEILARQAAILGATGVADGAGGTAPALAAPRRTGLAALAAASALLAIGALALVVHSERLIAPRPDVVAVSTATGQVLAETLTDDTRLWVDAETAAEARFDARHRRLSLARGRLFVEVAPDARRPFTVETEMFTATAVGTAFECAAFDGYSRVQVSEGHVRVAVDGVETTLAAGEALRVSADGAVRREAATAVASWRAYRLEFRSAPLSEALSEINRYRRIPIQVEDAEMARAPISGAFPVTALDEARTPDLLAAALGAQVQVGGPEGAVILSPQAP